MNIELSSRIKKEFPEFSKSDIDELLSFSSLKEYNKGEKIMTIGEQVPDEFYLVLDGIVRGYGRTKENEHKNLFFIIENYYFLSPERLFEGLNARNFHGFEAVTFSEILCIDYSRLLEKAAQNALFFKFHQRAINTILKGFTERIKLMIIEDAKKRYQHLCDNRPTVIENAQNKHIADFLGITPNSLSRILSSKFKK